MEEAEIQKLNPPSLPQEIADFLSFTPSINPLAIGEFISGEETIAKDVAVLFLRRLNFRGKSILAALLELLSAVHLPKEGQRVERLLEYYSWAYFDANKDLNQPHIFPFQNNDAVHLLLVAVVLLNTNLHNPKVTDKMNKKGFQAQLRGTNNGEDYPGSFLDNIFDHILSNPLSALGNIGAASTESTPHNQLASPSSGKIDMFFFSKEERKELQFGVERRRTLTETRELVHRRDVPLRQRPAVIVSAEETHPGKRQLLQCGYSVQLLANPALQRAIRVQQAKLLQQKLGIEPVSPASPPTPASPMPRLDVTKSVFVSYAAAARELFNTIWGQLFAVFSVTLTNSQNSAIAALCQHDCLRGLKHTLFCAAAFGCTTEMEASAIAIVKAAALPFVGWVAAESIFFVAASPFCAQLSGATWRGAATMIAEIYRHRRAAVALGQSPEQPPPTSKYFGLLPTQVPNHEIEAIYNAVRAYQRTASFALKFSSSSTEFQSSPVSPTTTPNQNTKTADQPIPDKLASDVISAIIGTVMTVPKHDSEALYAHLMTLLRMLQAVDAGDSEQWTGLELNEKPRTPLIVRLWDETVKDCLVAMTRALTGDAATAATLLPSSAAPDSVTVVVEATAEAISLIAGASFRHNEQCGADMLTTNPFLALLHCFNAVPSTSTGAPSQSRHAACASRVRLAVLRSTQRLLLSCCHDVSQVCDITEDASVKVPHRNNASQIARIGDHFASSPVAIAEAGTQRSTAGQPPSFADVTEAANTPPQQGVSVQPINLGTTAPQHVDPTPKPSVVFFPNIVPHGHGHYLFYSYSRLVALLSPVAVGLTITDQNAVELRGAAIQSLRIACQEIPVAVASLDFPSQSLREEITVDAMMLLMSLGFVGALGGGDHATQQAALGCVTGLLQAHLFRRHTSSSSSTNVAAGLSTLLNETLLPEAVQGYVLALQLDFNDLRGSAIDGLRWLAGHLTLPARSKKLQKSATVSLIRLVSPVTELTLNMLRGERISQDFDDWADSSLSAAARYFATFNLRPASYEQHSPIETSVTISTPSSAAATETPLSTKSPRQIFLPPGFQRCQPPTWLSSPSLAQTLSFLYNDCLGIPSSAVTGAPTGSAIPLPLAVSIDLGECMLTTCLLRALELPNLPLASKAQVATAVTKILETVMASVSHCEKPLDPDNKILTKKAAFTLFQACSQVIESSMLPTEVLAPYRNQEKKAKSLRSFSNATTQRVVDVPATRADSSPVGSPHRIGFEGEDRVATRYHSLSCVATILSQFLRHVLQKQSPGLCCGFEPDEGKAHTTAILNCASKLFSIVDTCFCLFEECENSLLSTSVFQAQRSRPHFHHPSTVGKCCLLAGFRLVFHACQVPNCNAAFVQQLLSGSTLALFDSFKHVHEYGVPLVEDTAYAPNAAPTTKHPFKSLVEEAVQDWGTLVATTTGIFPCEQTEEGDRGEDTKVHERSPNSLCWSVLRSPIVFRAAVGGLLVPNCPPKCVAAIGRYLSAFHSVELDHQQEKL